MHHHNATEQVKVGTSTMHAALGSLSRHCPRASLRARHGQSMPTRVSHLQRKQQSIYSDRHALHKVLQQALQLWHVSFCLLQSPLVLHSRETTAHLAGGVVPRGGLRPHACFCTSLEADESSSKHQLQTTYEACMPSASKHFSQFRQEILWNPAAFDVLQLLVVHSVTSLKDS